MHPAHNHNHSTVFRAVRTALFVSFALTAPLFMGCSDDSSSGSNPDGGDMNSDGGATRAESAWLYGFRTQTPEDLTYFMTVQPEIPSEPDFDTAVELGSSARIWSFGEHPYTWDGEDSTITRWNVDPETLELSHTEDDVLDFSGIGVAGDFGPPAFVSETQAFFFALPQGVVVEFDPTAMEIVEQIDVEPLVYEGIPSSPDGVWYATWQPVVRGDVVLLSVGNYDWENFTLPGKAEIAVFDTTTKTLEYRQNDFLAGAYEDFLEADDGTIYQRSSYALAAVVHYGDHDETIGEAGGLLRVNPDGTYDGAVTVDLMEALDADVVIWTPWVVGDELVVRYIPSGFEWPATWDEYREAEDAAGVWGAVDLTTLEVEPFTALDEYDLFGIQAIIDGTVYVWARTDPDGVQHHSLLRQESDGRYTEVTKIVGGQNRHLAKLW